MSENAFTQPVGPVIDRALVAQSDPQIISGARWFWWIAGLSLVNSVLIHGGSDTSFVIVFIVKGMLALRAALKAAAEPPPPPAAA